MSDILLARERRSEHIKQLIDSYQGKTIAVLKLNVVGEEKNPTFMKFICMLFNQQIHLEFKGKIQEFQKTNSCDGDYIYYVISEIGSIVKERTIYIEDHSYFGRLVDIDVYHNKGISRTDLQCEMRKCLICDGYAHVCSRNQTHSKEEIHKEVKRLIDETLPKMILNEVLSSIYYELDMYPRFGLVSKNDSGCHTDMDFDLFMISTYAIKNHIERFIEMGLGDINPLELQKIGRQAEKSMFDATNGVNTQKGLIFALGIFLPALVNTIINNEDETYLIQLIKSIANDIVGDYYLTVSQKENTTHGDKIYLTHGIKGIRGAALEGFNLLFGDISNIDGSFTDPFDYLLYFMSRLYDTTIIHKKGIEVQERVHAEIGDLIEKGGFKSSTLEYKALSDRYKKEGISPGGSSDLLVLKLIYENLRYLLKK
jgi:holo-ACP synthase CitX